MAKTTLLFSGGLDSTALAYQLQEWGDEVHALAVHYGQPHTEELVCAERTAHRLGLPYTLVVAPPLKGVGVENVYPGRNTVLLSLALSYALVHDCTKIAIGCNADDADDYVDCRAEFLESWNMLAELQGVNVEAPWVHMKKRSIVDLARSKGWPIEDSRSCYLSGVDPCGACPACVLRIRALA